MPFGTIGEGAYKPMRLGDRILMSRINCLTSSGTFGRPPRGRDFHRQYKRKPARCQRITVSGLTIAKALSTSGAKPYSPTNTIRSMLPRIGRLSDLRRRILSWCRSARISISSEARDRNNPISPHQISLQSSIIRQKFHPIRGSSPVVLGLRQGQTSSFQLSYRTPHWAPQMTFAKTSVSYRWMQCAS